MVATSPAPQTRVDISPPLGYRWNMIRAAGDSVVEEPLGAAVEDFVSERDGHATCDVYFSADIETDGPIPGEFSLLQFALVVAGTFDGTDFRTPERYDRYFVESVRPISERYEPEALRVNGLDRDRLQREGCDPFDAMSRAARWVLEQAGPGVPILVAYPLSFDWAWLYWYFTKFSASGSPFNHSRCFDLKTAFAVKARTPVAKAGHRNLPAELRSHRPHTHNALDDAIEQAEIFANIFRWSGRAELR